MRNLKIILLFLICIFSLESPAQTESLPQVSPPTPNASSLHVYGNNSVNYYTGAVNVEIPLFEVKEKGISVPITLKYTGGNGIKVQEIASWVGLGWTLYAGGAISRVRRNKADEDTFGGLFTLSDLTRPETINANDRYIDICQGTLDSEPDKFFYNYPGNSGEFFFDYNQQYHLKPKKNIKIDYQINYVSGEPFAYNPVQVSHNILDVLNITGENGMVYSFKDKEYSNSIGFNKEYSDNRGFPSTWYISQIQNSTGTSQVTFEYDPYRYSNMTMSGVLANTGEEEVYTLSTYIAKRLRRINFSKGSVEFIAGSENRKDLNDEKYLEFIIVRNRLGEIIKKYKFFYKYFTPAGLVNDDSSLAVSNKNRLALTSIQEFSGDGQDSKPPYLFHYNTENILPSRDSKSIDHWGYNNGVANDKFEPRYYFTWYNMSLGWVTDIFGSANREASPLYAKSGILTEVEYPAGGKTVFEYEGNTASNYSFSEEQETGKGLLLSWQNQAEIMEIANIAQTETEIMVRYQPMGGEVCYPIVHFENISTGSTFSLDFSSSYPTTQYAQLSDGQYNVWYVLHTSQSNTCNTQEDPVPVTISWTNVETSSTQERLVGGLRIQSVRDISEGGIVSERIFDYDGDDGISSGFLVSNPSYAFLIKDNISGDPIFMKRFSSSLYPLETTQGSHVGYGKVTVSKDVDHINGKTEYYYTTAEDFPDVFHGVTSDGSKQDSYIIHDGEKIPTFPIAEIDSKDYLRGLLERKNIFANNSGQLKLIYSLEQFYDNLYYMRDNPSTHMEWIVDGTEAVEGLKVFGEDCNYSSLYFKYYKIYTGYALPEKTVEKHFSGSNESLEETTITVYEKDSNGLIDWFNPIITKTTNSEGVNSIVRTFFPKEVLNENSLGLNSLTAGQKSAIQKLETDHRRSEPVQISLYLDLNKNGLPDAEELLSSERRVFKTENGLTLLETVQRLKGIYDSPYNVLEDRLIYKRYGKSGNPLEVALSNGPSMVYLWGYDDQVPIVKIENATYSEVASSLGITPEILDDYDENNLSAIDGLRTLLAKALITSYKYNSSLEVSSITDPKGNTIYYQYDRFNQLEFIKDENGKILKEYKYHYKEVQN